MRTIRTWDICVFGLAAAAFASSSAHAYYGKRAVEAQLRYSATVEVPLSTAPTVRSLNQSGHKARSVVDDQIQHLMGTFQSDSFRADFGYPGVLGEDHDVTFTKVDPAGGKGRYRISYDFQGKVVFQKEALD